MLVFVITRYGQPALFHGKIGVLLTQAKKIILCGKTVIIGVGGLEFS